MRRTIVERHRRELVAAARAAVRRFGTVREAARFVGMSRSTFHELCQANRIRFPHVTGARRNRR